MNTDTNQPDIAKRIRALHAWYCGAMGVKAEGVFALGPQSERYWFDWCQAGFNGKQLRKVMNFLRREICANRRNIGALKLRNLLNVETFQEDLFMCGANLDPDSKLPPSLESERKLES